jgi:NAD(P)-dependent dehydrogenase (short-subunit alcohol dehydrogenase family)
MLLPRARFGRRFSCQVAQHKKNLGRPGQPGELASIYVQLAASDGSFATGQVYGAVGGTGQP